MGSFKMKTRYNCRSSRSNRALPTDEGGEAVSKHKAVSPGYSNAVCWVVGSDFDVYDIGCIRDLPDVPTE